MPIDLQLLFFFVSILFLFFLPGWLVLSLRKKSQHRFSLFPLESLLFSFALGIGMMDAGMILLHFFNIPLSREALFFLSAFLIAIPSLFLLRNRSIVSLLSQKLHQTFSPPSSHNISLEKKEGESTTPLNADASNSFTSSQSSLGLSRRQSLLFLGIFFLTLTMKGAFLWNTILPTSTDLGHHMFWAQKIVLTEKLPRYEKININFSDGSNTLTAPEAIDDFIIGEHLPFAAFSKISTLPLLSAFPSLFLLIINVLTPLAIALLAFRFSEDLFHNHDLSKRAFLLAFLLAGPLWALSSPEAKYVSGGVVGNLFGNFFIPLFLLALFRALREKNPLLLTLSIFVGATLAFTHHLSTLVLLFIVLFSIFFFLVFHIRSAFWEMRSWIRLAFSPFPLTILILVLLFSFFISLPTYLDTASIDTAIGTPSKATREGLGFAEFTQGVGGARMGLALVSLLVILFSFARKTLSGAIAFGWGFSLLVMSLFPGALFLDIPSNRIGTYANFPMILLASLAFLFLFANHQRKFETPLPQYGIDPLLRISFATILVATIVGGFFDNAFSLTQAPNAKSAVQTFAVSRWAAERIRPDEWILKDHNYIVADSWMKFFFMRDYSYPLSRGYFRRYTDEATPREQCTLLMISAPNTPKGQSCFAATRVNTVIVNPHYDSAQFAKEKEMTLPYISDDIAVYRKKLP